jgi:hypothetical protein
LVLVWETLIKVKSLSVPGQTRVTRRIGGSVHLSMSVGSYVQINTHLRSHTLQNGSESSGSSQGPRPKIQEVLVGSSFARLSRSLGSCKQPLTVRACCGYGTESIHHEGEQGVSNLIKDLLTYGHVDVNRKRIADPNMDISSGSLVDNDITV